VTAINARTSAVEDAVNSGIVVTRVFDAPREVVWKAFTESERLMQWWGPKSFTMRVAKLDRRAGGVMRADEARLIMCFSEDEGRSSGASDWPAETLSTATLAEHEGRTAVTLQAVPLNVTPSKRKTVAAGHESITRQDYNGTLDQLGEYLAKA
jgi:hypothetical protein